MQKTILILLALLSSACSIKQHVTPLTYTEDTEKKICIVDNPKVRPGFVHEYRTSLTGKGFEVQMLEPSSSLNSCEFTSTFTANWAWNMALYMVYAEIKVYKNAAPSAEAVYDARHGGANMNKFIDAEAKVRELVDLLFPAVTAVTISTQ